MEAALKLPGMTMQKLQDMQAKAVAEICGPGGPLEIGEESWPAGFPGREREVRMRCFRGGPRTMRQYYEEGFARHGEKEFIIFRGERLTFAQTWQKVCALAAALVTDFGVRKGDRVACCMRNSPEWCITWIAATSIGAVIVPMNSWWQRKELEYGLTDSGSKVLVCDDLIYARIGSDLQRLGVACVRSRPQDGGAGVPTFDAAVRKHWGAPLPPAPQLKTDDFASIMYTSGTTGNPKGVVQTHRGMCNQMCMAMMGDMVKMKMGAALVAAGMPRPTAPPPQQCAICPVPLFHVTASHHIFLASIMLGGKLVLMEKWDAGNALRLIETERATAWTGVPTMVRDLMEHPNFAKTDTSSLERVGGGGAPTPPSQVGLMKKKFAKSQPGQGYGMTETNGAIAVSNGPQYEAKPESTGPPFPIVDVAIADPDTGKRLGSQQRGELLIRSPLNLHHYWRKEKATLETLVELEGHGYGWVRTGDIAELDAENFIYIRDRAKDIIIRGGENISCAEVEGAIFAHCPEVLEAACFGIKDSRLGEVVGVMVMLNQGQKLTAAQILDRLKGKVAGFKLPSESSIFFTESPLPRGATGKTMKRTIRDTVNTELKQGQRRTHRAKL
eukprot:TRINITY_DN5988_c0_g2_i1.p2 TRINITY_DN5988_c0_g2~~TRINITY_DN5988_c0_g2_i1.p2  ORF type:complete len:613 (+),score=234.47 TRINITY_DN5988_c0_g2_i1:95-1933(+)